ncbi:hypothetical protein [Trujillonella humicola]|uniref:hypothetical protein n=1 Tax=Trujillonella humicola TaxID=3383699 RepID=UPI0039058460
MSTPDPGGESSSIRACSLTGLAWRLGALPLSDLWWRYIEMGGNHSQPTLAAYLTGTTAWPATEHNALAHALNECLWEFGCASLAPYRTPDESGASLLWADLS